MYGEKTRRGFQALPPFTRRFDNNKRPIAPQMDKKMPRFTEGKAGRGFPFDLHGSHFFQVLIFIGRSRSLAAACLDNPFLGHQVDMAQRHR
ncbi:MAG: hypothetical protein GX577_04480 [Leptolinea sp.]|nr:hypothetical protein [Leptolinea sp.]